MSRCRRRRQGSAGGALMLSVGALLLALGLAQTVPSLSQCPAPTNPPSLPELPYQDPTEGVSGDFMSAFVQSFLNTVQPNPFPKDLLYRLIQDSQQVLSDKEIIKETLVYEIGFLVCAAIGILYIVLVPIVGFIMACCRCCGNCGGEMYQKQTSAVDCRRRTLYCGAFITTIVILAGNICMFRSNEALKVTVDQTSDAINKTLDNINTFLAAVPEEVNYLLNESYKTIQEVTSNLDTIGPLLGKDIQEAFRGTLEPALLAVKLLDEDTDSTSDQLSQLNSSLTQLQISMDRLQANVTAVRNRINQTLFSSNCDGCSRLLPELQNLDVLNRNVTIPNIYELQSAVEEVIRSNLTAKIKEVEDYFNNIPQKVTEDTSDVVLNSKALLDNIKAQMSQISEDIPVSTLKNISGSVEGVRRDIQKFTPEFERGEHIRWAVCVTLCCIVLLVVVCNLLGLSLGPLGLVAKEDPTKRSQTSNCGGIFLMMSAGFSFLFSWLFMILVLVLFLLGGNIYTLVCRPWNNGQLLKFMDTPGLIPGLSNIGETLGLKSKINISDIYKACEEDQPLWITLHLDELIDLEDLLNLSKYTDQIEQYFENSDIALSTITLLSPEVTNQLDRFSNKSKDIGSTDVTQQMNEVSSINLNATADELDKLADAQRDADTKKQLQKQAQDLREIQADIETSLIPQMETLNTTSQSLRSIAEKLNGTVGEALGNVGAAQDFLNTNTTQIVKTKSKTFLDCQLGFFIVYTDWANITITQHLGRCGPVAGAVNSAEEFLCLSLVESLNAFWFSLGWCLIFFIPSIIFSIKLAKFYRRMKHSDIFDGGLSMSPIPRAHIKGT